MSWCKWYKGIARPTVAYIVNEVYFITPHHMAVGNISLFLYKRNIYNNQIFI